MPEHPYLAELRAFAHAPRPTFAADYERHKRLLAEAIPAEVWMHMPIGPAQLERMKKMIRERGLTSE